MLSWSFHFQSIDDHRVCQIIQALWIRLQKVKFRFQFRTSMGPIFPNLSDRKMKFILKIHSIHYHSETRYSFCHIFSRWLSSNDRTNKKIMTGVMSKYKHWEKLSVQIKLCLMMLNKFLIQMRWICFLYFHQLYFISLSAESWTKHRTHSCLQFF